MHGCVRSTTCTTMALNPVQVQVGVEHMPRGPCPRRASSSGYTLELVLPTSKTPTHILHGLLLATLDNVFSVAHLN